MRVHDGPPAVQFLMDGSKHRMSEKPVFHACRLVLVGREHADAIGLERVEGVLDFTQAAIDVRQRQRREHAESSRMIPHQLRRILIALSRKPPRHIRVSEPQARRRNRGERRRRAGLVHVVESPGHGPAVGGIDRNVVFFRNGDVLRRPDVTVHVDPPRIGLCGSQRAGTRAFQNQRSRQTAKSAEKTPAGQPVQLFLSHRDPPL